MNTLTGGRYTSGFQGCIHTMENGHSKLIHFGMDAVSAVNVDSCPK